MKKAGSALTSQIPLTTAKTMKATSSIGDSKKPKINAGKYKSGSGIQKRHAFFFSALIFILMTIGIIF